MLKEELVNRKQFLEKMIGKTKESSEVKTGKLKCNFREGKWRYYFKNIGSPGYRYLSENDLKLAKDIAQAEYDKNVFEMAQRELKLIDSLLKIEDSDVFAKLYDDLKEGRKQLVSPHHVSNLFYADAWQKVPYTGNEKYEVTSTIKTRRGEYVRSKAEVAVADTLYALGIPYKYECPLKLNSGKVVYPDFTALNIRERKIYYVEYLGMLDIQEYRKEATFKINEYEKNGIFEGKNLLVFREYDGRGLDSQSIARRCREFLL